MIIGVDVDGDYTAVYFNINSTKHTQEGTQ